MPPILSPNHKNEDAVCASATIKNFGPMGGLNKLFIAQRILIESANSLSSVEIRRHPMQEAFARDWCAPRSTGQVAGCAKH